ncbi:bifunctional DNA primase/polymerase [Agrococcus beijingensis]|uniref:bifunctional DNA primase/polymerase n=1 Tax=Agrococcus beijingensis TaxID=3068634 RepID=UPI00274129AE|nr:bifunctional DNA primase/polymerase [Agrococcus sp. REN33]
MSGIYGKSAKAYRKTGLWPIPVQGKVNPPKGSTGHVGTVTPDKVKAWRRDRGGDNIAIRHDGTVAIDVDDGYGGKQGAKTLAQLEAKAGEPLPPTFTSTARGKSSPSRQHLYRIPEGVMLATNPGADVEVCQRHHRYSVVAPSVHPDTGKPYRWYGPDGERLDGPPQLEDVPFLPDAWREVLASGPVKVDPDADLDEILAAARAGDPSPAVEELVEKMHGLEHVGHNDFLGLSYQAIRLALEGHPGVPDALDELQRLHREYLIGSKGVTGRKANGEIARMLRTGAERAAGEPVEQTYGGTPIDLAPAKAQPITLEAAHEAFREWLGLEYDMDALDFSLSAYAVQLMTGDPVWGLIVSGPGNAKTETVHALAGAGARIVSSIASEGALLSATSKGERTNEATGGLLRELGDRGVLVLKDFTTILAMPSVIRGQMFAAFREIYDGKWGRQVGTDGGRVINWTGRITIVGAVTSAIDSAHGFVSEMGDRFVLLRVDSSRGRISAGRKALSNTGSEVRMREELAAAAGGVIAGADLTPTELDDGEATAILAAADLVTRARTHVQTDFKGEMVDAHAPEAPTRFAKQIGQVLRGAVAIGHSREAALRLALRVARDSVPPMRLAVLEDVAAHPGSPTREVAKRLQKPRTTVDRQLQALHLLGLLEVADTTNSSLWVYRLAPDVNMTAILPNPFH